MCTHPPERLFVWLLDWPIYAGRPVQQKTCVCCSACGAVLIAPAEPTDGEIRRCGNVWRAQRRTRKRLTEAAYERI